MASKWLIPLVTVGTGVAVLGLSKTVFAAKPPLAKQAFLKRLSKTKYKGFIPYYDYALEASKEYDVPFLLIAALMFKESSYRPSIVSKVGAIGLTQVMPRTGKAYCNMTERDLYNPRKNIMCGVKFLKHLHNQYKNWAKALAHYNYGVNIEHPNAKKYARLVLTFYNELKQETMLPVV